MTASLVNRRSYSWDVNLQLKDTGALTSSAACQVGGSNQILDFGTAAMEGVAVIDVSAIDLGSSDALYDLIVEGSNYSSFAGSAAVTLADMQLGHATPLAGGRASSVVGRYELPFINVQAGTQYEFVRMYVKIAGTISTGINFTAFVGLDPRIT